MQDDVEKGWQRVLDAYREMTSLPPYEMKDGRLTPESRQRSERNVGRFQEEGRAFVSLGPEAWERLREFFWEDDRYAFLLFTALDPEDLKPFLPEVLYKASWNNGSLGPARDLILSLPHDWLLKHLEGAADHLLEKGWCDDGYLDESYAYIVDTLAMVNRDLAIRFARRGLSHKDEGVRETAHMRLQELGVIDGDNNVD